MDTGVIYALFDPITHACCYVGKTSRALPERIIQHFNVPDTSARWTWIDDLKSRGLRPEIKILERTHVDDLDVAEIFWIRVMSRMGMPLTNTMNLEDVGEDISRYVVLRGDEESILVIVQSKDSQKPYVRPVPPKRRREIRFVKPSAKPLQYTHLTRHWIRDDQCVVCRDPRCDSINDAIMQGRPPNLIAAQYRFTREVVATHVRLHSEHRNDLSIEVSGVQIPRRSISLEEFRGNSAYDVLQQMRDAGMLGSEEPSPEPAFARFKQAWQDMQDDPRERARMVQWLNEQLQTEDMGLP